MTLQRTVIFVQGQPYPHYYLCPYLPVSAGRDMLSRSLLKFKHGRQPDLDGWIDCSLEALDGWIPPDTLILRALHHDETSVRSGTSASPGRPSSLDQLSSPGRPSSLDRLGLALAAQSRSRYQPSLLHKSRTTRPIKDFSFEKREAELRDSYYLEEPASFPSVASPGNPPAAPALPSAILILDDILTTATTLSAIIDVLRPRFPVSAISVFTLARASYETGAGTDFHLRGRNYHLQPDMDWTAADPK